MGVLDTLNASTAGGESVKIITDSKVRAEWVEAVNNLDAAARKDAASASLKGKPATTAAVEHLESLRDRVAASEVEFFFEPMVWTEYIALQAMHPPKSGDPLDARRGYNIATFTDALIRASCVRAVGADESVLTDIPAETWDRLLGAPARPAQGKKPAQPAVRPALDYGAVNDLGTKAFKANAGDRTVPPSASSLLGTQDSATSSTPPKPGKSARAASTAGSRRGSRTSSTTAKKPDRTSLASPAGT